jgi:hypothetical protein
MQRVSILASIALFAMASGAVGQPGSQVELLAGHGVDEFGDALTVQVTETPAGTPGFFLFMLGNGLRYGGTLDCIYVDGNSAYVSGQLTFGDDPGVGTPPLGLGIGFKITDNQGLGIPDSRSSFAIGPGIVPGLLDNPAFRAALDGSPTVSFTSGNMYVRD